MNVILEAQHLHARGMRVAALDLVFDKIGQLLLEGEFDAVDDLLLYTPVSDLDEGILVGVLAATRPEKTRLARRHHFYHTALSELDLRHGPEEAQRLLAGLK